MSELPWSQHISSWSERDVNQLLSLPIDVPYMHEANASVLKKRTDPITFLREHFNGSPRLMRAMTRSGTCFLGSQAANFFAPGSAAPDSDFDFYCPNHAFSIAMMLEELEKCGVRWTFCLEELCQKLHATPRGMSCFVTWELVDGVRHKSNLRIDAYQPNFRAYISPLLGRELSPEVIDRTKHQVVLHPEQGHLRIEVINSRTAEALQNAILDTPTHHQWSYRDLSVINGMSLKSTKVQLIVDGNAGPQFSRDKVYLGMRSVLRNVVSFHSSCVQAFICGSFAAHMYYPETCTRRSYRWIVSTSRTPKANIARSKYESRGYTYKQPLTARRRCMADYGARIIPFSAEAEELLVRELDRTPKEYVDEPAHDQDMSALELRVALDLTWNERLNYVEWQKGPRAGLSHAFGSFRVETTDRAINLCKLYGLDVQFHLQERLV